MTRRRGFTLVELLVSIALTLFILTILGQAFALGTDTFRTLKAVGDLNGSLRTAANIIRSDLAADHFEGKRRLSDERFVRWESATNTEPESKYDGPPQQGYFFVWTPPVSPAVVPFYDVNEGNDADGIVSRRRASHVLAFTVKARGNKPQNYFSAMIPSFALNPEGRFEQPGTFNSQWIEVVYFVKPLAQLPGAPPLSALYRQVRLVVADVDQFNWGATVIPYPPPPQLQTLPNAVSCMKNPNGAFSNKLYFNSPSDLTIPERRTAGSFGLLATPPLTGVFLNSFKPLMTPPDPPNVENRNGGDLLLTDVLSFDVKVLRAASPRAPAGSGSDDFEDLPAPHYYDTWTRRVDDMYDYSNPTLKPIPNSSYRITALHITLRVWDAKTQLTRQITVIQDM